MTGTLVYAVVSSTVWLLAEWPDGEHGPTWF
jgi:hypothetical protein